MPPQYQASELDVFQLACVGLLTGLCLAMRAVESYSGMWLAIGFCGYLRVYLRFRSPARIACFAAIMMAGTLASAVLASLVAWSPRHPAAPLVPLSAYLLMGGGAIGSTLLGGWAVLIPAARRGRLFVPTLVLALAGVGIAAVGWFAAPTLGRSLWDGFDTAWALRPMVPRDLPRFVTFSSVVVTAAGEGTLLGLLLYLGCPAPTTTDGSPEGRPRPFWPVYLALVPLIAAVIMGAVRGTAIERQLAATPPAAVKAWPVSARPFDTVFVSQSFGPLAPAQPVYDTRLASDVRTIAAEYRLRYASGPAVFTDVAIRQYPTAAWSAWELRQLPSPACFHLYPQTIRRVSRFGADVLSCHFVDDPNVYWRSDDVTVEIRAYEGGQLPDDMIAAYLTRYPPSTLPAAFAALRSDGS